MGRRKVPLDQLKPSSVKHNRSLYKDRVPSPKPQGSLGRPSTWLTAKEKKIWKALVKSAPAVLGESDRPLMEIAVTLKAKLEDHTIENAQITQLINCLNKLGMIPADRKPVAEPKPEKEADPLDEFTNASKEA